MSDRLRAGFWIIVALFTLFLIYLFAPVLTPFLEGATLAYLFNPVVDKLESWRIPRTLSVVSVFFILLLFLIWMLFVLVPLISHQISNIVVSIPTVISWAEGTFFPWLEEHFHIVINIDVHHFKTIIAKQLRESDGLFMNVWSTLTYSGHTLLLWGTNLLLVPVVMFYLLRDWHKVLQGIRNLIPRPAETTMITLANECQSRLGGFLRGQLMVMLCLGILYSIGLRIVGLNVAIVIGLGAGFISIIPYLGFIVGIVAASIAALLQFHSTMPLLWVLIVFLVAQSIEAVALTPFFVGDRIGMHPVAVLFAILAGGQLFGFMGILLALPVAAVLMVFMRYFRKQYMSSTVYVQGT